MKFVEKSLSSKVFDKFWWGNQKIGGAMAPLCTGTTASEVTDSIICFSMNSIAYANELYCKQIKHRNLPLTLFQRGNGVC